MLLILALCVIRPAAATSSDVHTTHSESDFGNNDARPVDVDEYGVRNYVSDHELPRDVPTRVEIVGDLGTPPPSVRIDFVPKQTYVQVRRYDAVKRLPQEAAMKEASTSEEVANASRLREVVTHKKTQEIYEEQGYEDAGYDHGGSKKLKVEEEIKDNQSEEAYRPKNDSSHFEETKDHVATVAPSGRGTWSRHKTTTGKKTKYEEDGKKRKVTTNDSSPISEKSSGNYTKFDGGKTIVVQNITETERKDLKKDGAESRRVASFSKTKDDVEPTTYRPTMRYEAPRHTIKQIKNEQKRNRTRNRPRKRQETDVQKPQTDVIGSYDNSPWIPMSPPTDYKRPSLSENKKQVKSIMNSELHEPNGHSTRYGYTVNHDTPYQYVLPTETLAPASSNKPKRKLKPKTENSGNVESKLKSSSYSNYEFIPQTNYDGSAINSKQKVKKTSEENFSFENTNLPLNNKFKEPTTTQFKINFNHNVQQNGRATIPRQKINLGQVESSENVNSHFKSETYREQKKKGHRDVEFGLGNHGNSGSRYKIQSSTISPDFELPKNYEGPPFITKLKKNNFNSDSRGDPTLRIYPKYEFYPSFQNVKHPVNDEFHHDKRLLSSINKGYANTELNESPPRIMTHESTRLTEYSKLNNKPKSVYQQPAEASENWENYSTVRGQNGQLLEKKYPKINNAENYPKFESNKEFERTKQSPIYRLIPYEKSIKINNPYSYVYNDDHYPSGSRYSGVKVEMTTQSSSLNDRKVYWNNRHPHLPRDSIKNISGRNKSEDENTRHVENLTLAYFSGRHKPGSYHPLPLEYNERVNNLAKLLNDNYPRRTKRDLEVIHIASSGTTTEIPIDTDIYPHYKNAPKQSALRYATNPVLAPRKTAGGMEFYASTNNVQCDDMSAPDNIVPERTNDGEWKGEPSNNSPRIDALGDKIGCFKKKYFGSDPLDNPIFKEKDVGLPDVLFSKKKPPEYKEVIEPGKPHVDWNFADELIPGNWFPDKDKRNRRSNNNSVPNNHKVQGMASLMPEPVILTFPTKVSTVIFTNNSKLDTENVDSEVSSNEEHVLKYSIQHPTAKPDTIPRKTHLSTDDKIVGLFPPPQITTTTKSKKHLKIKKPITKKILKKVKVDESNEADLLDVFSPITSFFTDENDEMTAPIVHNFFNIKMTPSTKLKTTTTVDNNSDERVNRFNMQNYKRTKRNMKGIELQKPKIRKLNIDTNSNVSLSSPTARVRMYSPKNGTWFRAKRDHVFVNVDTRRKEPRYYYHKEQPHFRVKRVVHNPPFHSRSGQIFSSKYLVPDQDNSETLPEEINVAFSTTPKPIYESTTKFIPAIAFGDSKTKIIKFNDSIANSTNNIALTPSNFDKKGSLIYVINPDTGHGKWMQVIKIKTEEDTKSALTNGPVYLEKKVKDGIAEESIGKFGFKGSNKDFFKNLLGSKIDHRFKTKPVKSISTEPIKLPREFKESKEQSQKVDCPKLKKEKKKEVRRRTTTTTTTTEIPVIEEVDDRPEEQSGEEESIGPQEDEEEVSENEEEPPVERPYLHHSDQKDHQDQHNLQDQHDQYDQREQDQHEQQESEENPGNVEDDDQDIHESKRKNPYYSQNFQRRPNFSGYLFG